MKTRSGATPRNRFSPYFRRKKASTTKEKKLTSQDKKQLDNISTSLNNKFNCVKAEHAIGTLSDTSSDSEVNDDNKVKNRNLLQSAKSGGGSTSLAKTAKNSTIKTEPNSLKKTAVPHQTTSRKTRARRTVKQPPPKQPPAKQAKGGRPLRNSRIKPKGTYGKLAEEKAVLDAIQSEDSDDQLPSGSEYRLSSGSEYQMSSDSEDEFSSGTEYQSSDEVISSEEDFDIPERKKKTPSKRKQKTNTGNRSNVKNTHSRSGLTRKADSKSNQLFAAMEALKNTYSRSGLTGTADTKSNQLSAAVVALKTADQSDENKLNNILNGSNAMASNSKRKINTGSHSYVKNTPSRSGLTGISGTKSNQLSTGTVTINAAEETDENKPNNVINSSDVITSSSIIRDCANESDSDIEWEDVGHVGHEGLYFFIIRFLSYIFVYCTVCTYVLI